MVNWTKEIENLGGNLQDKKSMPDSVWSAFQVLKGWHDANASWYNGLEGNEHVTRDELKKGMRFAEIQTELALAILLWRQG